MNRHKKKKPMNLKAGDIVQYSGGLLLYYEEWIKENQLCLTQKYFNDKIMGKVLGLRASGPMYRVVEIDGEQFEILQAQLTKMDTGVL